MSLTLASIVAHWSFENNLNDDTGNGNTLTANGTPTYPSGKIGSYCMDLEISDATIPYAYRNDNTYLSVGDIGFFMCGWFKPESLTTYHNLISKWGDAPTLEYDLIVAATTYVVTLYVSNNGTAFTSVNSSSSLTTGTWYFVAAWHDPDANKIYISINDGTVSEQAHSGGIYDSTSQFRIGARETPASIYAFDGSIDNVLIAKAVPSAANLTWLYNSGNGRSWANIVTYLTAKPKFQSIISGA